MRAFVKSRLTFADTASEPISLLAERECYRTNLYRGGRASKAKVLIANLDPILRGLLKALGGSARSSGQMLAKCEGNPWPRNGLRRLINA